MSINPDKLKAMTNSSTEAHTTIEQELAEQKEILLKIYEQTQKTRRYIMIGKIISFVYLLLLVVPMILAAIYLPPLLKNVVAPYQELLGQSNNNGIDMSQMSNLLKQFGK